MRKYKQLNIILADIRVNKWKENSPSLTTKNSSYYPGLCDRIVELEDIYLFAKLGKTTTVPNVYEI